MTLRVLVLSSIFPSRGRPSFGVFVSERVRSISQHCDVVVVAPVPWFPLNRWIRGRHTAFTPLRETVDGLTVYHPRFLCIPAIAKCLDGLLYFLCVLPVLVRLRHRFRFDIIDAHFTYPDGVAAALFAKWFRCPALITVRGSHDLRQASYWLRAIQIQRALRAATRLIAVSDSLRVVVDRLAVRRDVRVIPNGVDASRFRPRDQAAARAALGLGRDQAILISVGHLVEGKGHHRIVEALPDLVARRPDLLYIVIGGGVRGDHTGEVIEHLVRRYGLEKHVRIIPIRPHDEIPLWLSAADLFCLATRIEGWCNALMEALACGVPVVTTQVGGNSEVVRDGMDGLLVPFWDAGAFVDAVLHALDKPWDRAAIARRMRAHGWDRTAEQVMEEFRTALPPDGALSVGDRQQSNRR